MINETPLFFQVVSKFHAEMEAPVAMAKSRLEDLLNEQQLDVQ